MNNGIFIKTYNQIKKNFGGQGEMYVLPLEPVVLFNFDIVSAFDDYDDFLCDAEDFRGYWWVHMQENKIPTDMEITDFKKVFS